MKRSSKAIGFLKDHLVDSTAIIAESTPVFALSETVLVGMSDKVSLNARLFAAMLVYSGIGFVFGKGRDISRNFFKIDGTTSEKIQNLHDTLYTGAFNLVTAPAIYYISGEQDLEKILYGTALATGLGAINGSPTGYSIDIFRDLTGLKKSERISRFVNRYSSGIKKGIVALLIAGSISLTAGIYYATQNNEITHQTIQ